MTFLLALARLLWGAVEAVFAIPRNLRAQMVSDWREWKRKQALYMVLTTAWPEGFDPKPLAHMVLECEDVELTGWVYNDRSFRLTTRGSRGVVYVHPKSDGVYTVTDLSGSQTS